MLIKKYKIIVAYDGTDFYGWQVQPGHPTIAGVLEDTFASVFGKEITIAGASRTDAGVHALGQAACFSTDLSISAEQMLTALHNVLPDSIKIHCLQEIASDWNPRYPVVQKTYYYHFFAQRPSPLVARYGWHYRYPVDIQKLHECLQLFVGTHDFRSFCTGDDYENTVRRIDYAAVEFVPEWNAHRIIIKGPGFLRYMIRRIAGACLEVASRDTLGIDDLQKALDQKNPLQLLPTAPAKGLMLYEIVYQ